jgi:sec-independent protein translocase protein TatC
MPTNPETIENDREMSLFDHLNELRGRLIFSILSILAVFAIAMVFSTELIQFINVPLAKALPDNMKTLHFTGPMDVFIAQIKVGGMCAIIFACPVWVFQLWQFVAPALHKHERIYAIPFVLASILLFFTGIGFSFFVVIPMALKFLITLGTEAGATPIITINDYISVLTVLVIGFGVVFQMPILLVLLAVLELITLEFLIQYRKMMLILILVMAAVLTPPDPLSQMAMALPMYVMYELSIILIRLIEKGRKIPETEK